MSWFLYVCLAIPVLMFGAIFVGFIVAGIMDWRWRRENRLFVELQRDYNKPRRPAAK